jgi:hypothetical protein
MTTSTVQLNTPLKSHAGNTYYKVKFLNKDLLVTINPRWKSAHEQAILQKKPNTQPTFMLKADGNKEQYDGMGAAWVMVRKEGKCHQGNFRVDNSNYFVDIRKNEDGTSFSMTLTLKEDDISLDDL